jgi:serine/threonine-protein kinase
VTERFTLLEKIGRGGMGVVWRARDEETGQIVALKLLHSAYSDDPDYVTRFERELELARRIKSPNVVGVIGYGVREGTPYLALEYVDGKSLRERLASRGPYTWQETKPLLAQIAQGLADAHAAGVVHRDIKPSNILIGSDGVAKIADFGIARGLDLTRVTGTSTLLGTPAYLPPEGPQDERSDLYSLGIVAYELLAGVPPFEGSTYAEVIMAHVRIPPDLERLPAETRPIVGWLLEKDPKLRPQSAAELIGALQGKQAVPTVVAVAPELANAAASVIPAAPAALGSYPYPPAPYPPAQYSPAPASYQSAAYAPAAQGPTTRRSRSRRQMALFAVVGLLVVLVIAATAILSAGHPGQTVATQWAADQPTQEQVQTQALPQTAGPQNGASLTQGGAPGAVTVPPVVTRPPATPVVTRPPATPVVTRPPATPIVTRPPATPIVTPSPPPPTTAPTPPAAPSGLTVTAISGTAIRLNWSDNSNNETGFEMDNGTSDLGSVPANTTTWTKTGLADGTYMCFHIYAFNAAGHSAWTPYACTTTP